MSKERVAAKARAARKREVALKKRALLDVRRAMQALTLHRVAAAVNCAISAVCSSGEALLSVG
jgi:hypothetical protein